jgi:hypothetical protein
MISVPKEYFRKNMHQKEGKPPPQKKKGGTRVFKNCFPGIYFLA